MRLVDISYRQLQYWDRTHFISPHKRRGKYRLYGLNDVILLALMTELRQLKVSVQKGRRIIQDIKDLLPGVSRSLGDLKILIGFERGTIILSSGDLLLNHVAEKGFFVFSVENLIEKIELTFPEEERHHPLRINLESIRTR